MNNGIAKNEWIIWGITLKENPQKIIGTICLWNLNIKKKLAEIGYLLHPEFQGKGIMQETMQIVLDFGFNKMKLKLIEAVLEAENHRSIKLLERNNFVFDREAKGLVIYALKSGANESIEVNV